ncbi:TetR/AcrR family transcriptional regulator C-terminal domain-containing protein [Actinocorallia aurea]
MAAEETLKPSVWERIDTAGAQTRATLSHAVIAEAAVELADAEGLEAVTIRKLAGRLGVTAMALYRYVENKEEILELMVDAVYASQPVPETGGWRAVLAEGAHAERRVHLAHPWIAQATTRVPIGLIPNRMLVGERVLASLDGLGLDADTKMAVADTVSAYTRGAVGAEATMAELRHREGVTDGDGMRDAYARRMRHLMETGRYPAVHAWARTAQRKDDDDWRFALGLDIVLNGIADTFDLP